MKARGPNIFHKKKIKEEKGTMHLLFPIIPESFGNKEKKKKGIKKTLKIVC